MRVLLDKMLSAGVQAVVDDAAAGPAARQIAVSVALTADDVDTAVRGLRLMTLERTLAGLLAGTALAALAAGERRGRDAVSGAVMAEILDRWTATAVVRHEPAPASAWEGRHSVMGSVVDELLRAAH